MMPAWQNTLRSARALRDQGRIDQAIDQVADALKEVGDDQEGAIQLNHALVGFYLDRDQWSNAVAPLQREIEILEGRGLQSTLAARYNTLGMLYTMTGNKTGCVEAMENALRVHRAVSGDRNDTVITQLVVLGDALLKAGRAADAQARFQEALDLVKAGVSTSFSIAELDARVQKAMEAAVH